MKKLSILIICIIFVIYCGHTGNNRNAGNSQTATVKTGKKKSSIANVGTEKRVKKLIKEIKFASGAMAGQDLVAEIVLEESNEDTEFEFEWYVNDQGVTDVEANVLPSSKFKMGDWIFCRVIGIRSGKREKPVKSRYIRVAGLPPKLDLEPVPTFTIPGMFSYHLAVSDPNDKANKNIKFLLLAPTDAGILLDEKTGDLEWQLTEKLVAKYGPKVEIKFKVSNKHGDLVSSIFLDLGNSFSGVN